MAWVRTAPGLGIGAGTSSQGCPPRRTAADFTLGYFRLLSTGGNAVVDRFRGREEPVTRQSPFMRSPWVREAYGADSKHLFEGHTEANLRAIGPEVKI